MVPPSPQCVPAALPAGPGKVSRQPASLQRAGLALGGGSNHELVSDLGAPFQLQGLGWWSQEVTSSKQQTCITLQRSQARHLGAA